MANTYPKDQTTTLSSMAQRNASDVVSASVGGWPSLPTMRSVVLRQILKTLVDMSSNAGL